MQTRSCVLVFLFLLVAAAAGAQVIPPPPAPTLEGRCDGGSFVLDVFYHNYDPDLATISVERVEAVPGLPGSALLTPTPVATPFDETTVLALPDPAVDPEGFARYVVRAYWPDGSEAISWDFDVSCVESPLAMIGFLDSATEFSPCTNHALLECDVVSLYWGELNAYAGTGELLMVHGWPLFYGSPTSCVLEVFAIESLGTGQGCGDVVPAADLSWGAVKARYW